MIAVLFEVLVSEGAEGEYLDIAARLLPELQKTPGFISVERFQSLTEPAKLLSLSFWEDQTAVKAWRGHSEHRQAQRHGRAGVFDNYRLRIAEVQRDYGMHDRSQAPTDALAGDTRH